MKYSKELLPTQLIHHNDICNQNDFVRIIFAHNLINWNTEFETPLLCLFHNALTGKANAFILKNINSSDLSNALRQYTPNKPIFLLTNLDFENEVSIQHPSFIRFGENSKTYISNENSYKCATFKDNQPEDVGIHIVNSF